MMILLITLMEKYQILEDNHGNLYMQSKDETKRPLTMFEVSLVRQFLEWASAGSLTTEGVIDYE